MWIRNMKRKFKHWWSSIPIISTKQTIITFHLNSLSTKRARQMTFVIYFTSISVILFLLDFELLRQCAVYLLVLTAESFSLILNILVMIFRSMCGISYISENGWRMGNNRLVPLLYNWCTLTTANNLKLRSYSKEQLLRDN